MSQSLQECQSGHLYIFPTKVFPLTPYASTTGKFSPKLTHRYCQMRRDFYSNLYLSLLLSLSLLFSHWPSQSLGSALTIQFRIVICYQMKAQPYREDLTKSETQQEHQSTISVHRICLRMRCDLQPAWPNEDLPRKLINAKQAQEKKHSIDCLEERALGGEATELSGYQTNRTFCNLPFPSPPPPSLKLGCFFVTYSHTSQHWQRLVLLEHNINH